MFHDSPVGLLELKAEDGFLVGVGKVEYPGTKIIPSVPASAVLYETAHQLDEYFSGLLQTFKLPLKVHGTPFREAVWTELQKIPYGKTISYAELAQRVGRPRAFRAAGTANGHNPVCIIIPCHRVICSDGSIGGYAYGTAMKDCLLRLESR